MRVVCPHCLKVNNIPKKDEYKKANCGACKASILDNKVIDAISSNFDEIVVNSELPVVVDFWASWCGPCKMMAPVFKDVAKEYPLKTLFVKVNTEEEQTLSAKFAIRSIPTIIMMKNGKEVDRVSGAMDQQSLKNWINRFI